MLQVALVVLIDAGVARVVQLKPEGTSCLHLPADGWVLRISEGATAFHRKGGEMTQSLLDF